MRVFLESEDDGVELHQCKQFFLRLEKGYFGNGDFNYNFSYQRLTGDSIDSTYLVLCDTMRRHLSDYSNVDVCSKI